VQYYTRPEVRKRQNQSHAQYRTNPEQKKRERQYSERYRAQWRDNPEYKEKARRRSAQWLADPEHKKHDQQRSAQYRATPEVKERKRQYDAQRYANPENKEKARQYTARRLAQPEVKRQKRVHEANRNARKRLLPNTLTSEQWEAALNYFHGCCAICGRQMNDMFGEFRAAMDHWVPLAYGGADNPGTVAVNILPVCHGIGGCNNSKNDAMPGVWLRQRYSERKSRQIEKRIAEYFEWVISTR
jgi:hypothetical protein